jgi:hypothetical protein
MHRLIMGPGPQVDHKDGNGLNNRRSDNLRFATDTQNRANQKVRKDSTTGFKGVRPHRDKFQARIRVKGREITLGSFATPEEAALAYNAAAKECFGEFARPNPMG